MRVVITVSPPVGGRSEVEVKIDSGAQISSHLMERLKDPPWVAVPGDSSQTQQMAELIGRLKAEELESGDVQVLGAYLFDCLLGRLARKVHGDSDQPREDHYPESD